MTQQIEVKQLLGLNFPCLGFLLTKKSVKSEIVNYSFRITMGEGDSSSAEVMEVLSTVPHCCSYLLKKTL